MPHIQFTRNYAFIGSNLWYHYGHDGVSNHQPSDCLLTRLSRRRLKKTSKLRVTGLCVGNSPMRGEFPAHMASNAESVSIWWRHHVFFAHGTYQNTFPEATTIQSIITFAVVSWCWAIIGIISDQLKCKRKDGVTYMLFLLVYKTSYNGTLQHRAHGN